MKPISEIAKKLNLPEEGLIQYGKYKAKVPLKYIDESKIKDAKLVLVTAISPTPAGEGKTTMSIGLTEALNSLGKRASVVLREPSLGPVFGIKGGATGGGLSQVLPMEDINLHFTGDFAAIEKAHNLLSALVDNNIQSKKRSLGIDPRTVSWKRVFDVNDRSLRHIIVGLGGASSGMPRETGFDITAASEIMAILCLAENLEDLKERLGNIFIGYTFEKNPVYARDLNAQGAMAMLLKDAIMPNLVQTLEGNPAFIHGGPFANIAQGTNSVIATKMALSRSEFVVTEAGFGSDLGAEKFMDIKCVSAGLKPDTVVIVATIRALRYHGGQDPKDLSTPSIEHLRKGVENLRKHVENMRYFDVCPVVAINKFATDSDEEINFIKDFCQELNVPVELANVWGEGGKGAMDLGKLVIQSTEKCRCECSFKPLYDWNMTPEEKIEIITTKMYGADGVEYTPTAKRALKTVYNLGLEKLPVCIAKTQKSLSDNPKLIGRPKNFTVTVRDIEIAAGAKFIVPITGDIMRMPGLPETPAAERMDIDNDGNISGLF